MPDGDLAWAEELIAHHTRGRVVDVGCGDGRFLPAGAVGVDIDVVRLATARGRSVLLAVADARGLPFRGASFDTAYAHRMLNDAAPVDLVLAGIVRILRDDGRLLVFTRARSAEGDRLDRGNGTARLAPFFTHVTRIEHPSDERSAFFVAEGPIR
ncbi:MAG: class I SAM-dependent methyltransferase [Chloroflexi bacterium]|nr:class I SAM-dependent methyltransferase [Chloroflexota bacterium]